MQDRRPYGHKIDGMEKGVQASKNQQQKSSLSALVTQEYPKIPPPSDPAFPCAGYLAHPFEKLIVF